MRMIDTIDVKDPAVVDLLSGESFKTGPASVPGETARALRVRWPDGRRERFGDVAADKTRVLRRGTGKAF